MRWMRYTTCLWPGLPQLWWQGAHWGLVAAVGFAVAVNFALLSSVVWWQLLDPSARNALWMSIASVWLVSAAVSLRLRRRWLPGSAEQVEGDLFPEAVDEYLKGNWLQAEQLLARLLERDRRDVPARLTLATLLRRTGRLDEAEGELGRLAAFEDAEPWQFEIGRELAALGRKRSEDSRQEETSGEADAVDTDASDRTDKPPAEVSSAA